MKKSSGSYFSTSIHHTYIIKSRSFYHIKNEGRVGSMKAFYNCLEKLKIQPKINISTLHPSQFPNVKIYKDSFPISPSYTLEINYRPLWNIDSRHKDSFLHCSWKQSHTEGDLTIHHSHTHTHLPLSLSTTLMIPALARICMGDHRYGD